MPNDPAPDDDLVARAYQAIERLADRPLRGREGLPGSQWHYHDRKTGEWGVVETLADELRSSGRRNYHDVVPRHETRPPTPPDVLARNEKGELVGFEVSEIVSQQVIELNLERREAMRAHLMNVASPSELELFRSSGKSIEQCVSQQKHIDAQFVSSPVYFRWSPESLAQELEKVIASKGKRPFVVDGETYAERVLVLHTDEMTIGESMAASAVALVTSGRGPFDDVWLVLGYHPVVHSDGYYPVIHVA